MITISQSHLSHLNQVISTQHKLLKLRLDSEDRPELNKLFADFQKLNTKFSTLYSNLQLGTIVLQDKIHQQQKHKQMLKQMEGIEGLLKNIQIEKQNLEESAEMYKKQCGQQVIAISRLTAELNKLSSERMIDKQKIRQLKQKSKEFKEIEENAKVYKKQVKILKQKIDTLQQKCKLLQKMQRKQDQQIGDELDKELQELENQIQE